jgi:hypothetical protein
MSFKEITPLQISDKEFLIASTIERCPKVMMLRELMMNAIEATALNRANQAICAGCAVT